jgi:hypothetical protein
MENVIIAFIELLHREIANYEPCILVLDIYRNHRTERVIAATEENDLELFFVPACGTDALPNIRRTEGEGAR